MCWNSNKKIEVLFQKVAKEVYNNKKRAEGKNTEVVTDFNALMSEIPSLSPVLCEDQYFGIVNFEKNSSCGWVITPVYLHSKKLDAKENEKPELQANRRQNAKRIEQANVLKTIVIVLESPHTDEFINGKKGYTAIGPACGTTGENLYKWLPEVLMNYVPCEVDFENATATYNEDEAICSGEYKVKLINAIQSQCSLGVDTDEYRNLVFNRMWNEDIVKASFHERLQCANPNIIINCCTKGDGIKERNQELRYIVQKELNAKFGKSDCLLLRATHPSSYHFKNGLALVDGDEEQI